MYFLNRTVSSVGIFSPSTSPELNDLEVNKPLNIEDNSKPVVSDEDIEMFYGVSSFHF